MLRCLCVSSVRIQACTSIVCPFYYRHLRKKLRTMSYQPLEYRLLLLHGAFQAAPRYLQNKPLNLNICWSCLQKSKCFHCSQCLVVRYCGLTCQKADWAQHKLACVSLRHFVLKTRLGKKLYECMKLITWDEPLYFCEVLEYLARASASRSERRHQQESLAAEKVLFVIKSL